jgi:hypothetical protein
LHIKKTKTLPAPKEIQHDENGPDAVSSTQLPHTSLQTTSIPPQLLVVSPLSGAAWRVNVVYQQQRPKCRVRVIQSQGKG